MSSKEFLFMLDLSGFAALTDVHGGRAAADTVSRLLKVVNETILPDVFLEDRVGDELILSSMKGESLLKTCFIIQSQLEKEDNFLSFHAALHYGEIFREADGLFSTTVNVAARITSMAKSTQILCSKDFVNNCTIPERFELQNLGAFKFKNILDKVEVYEIMDKEGVKIGNVVDPVCKMKIKIEENTPKTELKNQFYYFCSERCRIYFENHPNNFILKA
jgi:class 3 adenylate cyclase/YHS domain-containing protein